MTARPTPVVPFFVVTVAVLVGVAVGSVLGAGNVSFAIWLVYIGAAWAAMAVYMGRDVYRAGGGARQASLVGALVVVFWPLGMYLWARLRRPGPIFTPWAKRLGVAYLVVLGGTVIAAIVLVAIAAIRGPKPVTNDAALARSLVLTKDDLPTTRYWEDRGRSGSTDTFLGTCLGFPATATGVSTGPRLLGIAEEVDSTGVVYPSASEAATRVSIYRSGQYLTCAHDALIHTFHGKNVSDVNVQRLDEPTSPDTLIGIRVAYNRTSTLAVNFWADRIVIFHDRLAVIVIYQTSLHPPDPSIENSIITSARAKLDLST